MVGRPGRIKSKGSEASTSQDGDAPRSGKRQGRPRKSKGSEFGSRESSPFSPSNHLSSVKRRARKGEPRLVSEITEFDQDEELRSHRLERFIDEHPDSREEYARLLVERSCYPPWIEEKEVIEHDGTAYRIGDIVCVFDEEDLQNEHEDYQDLPYYAQIRSLITDQYMRAYAWITWLAPKHSAVFAHNFSPDHFSHTLIDYKLYEVECLRWVGDRPQLPAYQIVNEHSTVLDKYRMGQFRARRTELLKAASLVQNKNAVDVMRAGDVRAMHSKEHEDDMKEVLETMAKRDAERRENEERMQDDEEDEDEEEDEEEDEDEEESDDELEEEKKGSDNSDNDDKSGNDEDEEEEDEEEEEEEDEKPPEVPRDGKRMMLWKRGNITTITKPGAGPPKPTNADGAMRTGED